MYTLAANVVLAIAIASVLPIAVITTRRRLGLVPTERQILLWFGIQAAVQMVNAFASLPFTLMTVIISIGVGAAVILIYDIVRVYHVSSER